MTPYQALKKGYRITISKDKFTPTTFSWKDKSVFMENKSVGNYARRDLTAKLFNHHVDNMLKMNFNVEYVHSDAVKFSGEVIL